VKFKKGQSLVEILVAVAIGTILIGGSVGLMGVSIKSYGTVRKHLQANVLIRQAAEVIQSLARSNWHNIYDLTKGTDYKISLSGNFWTISTGQETGIVNNVPYKRYFQVNDVNRDASDNIAEVGTDDPSTQKITIILEYGNNYTSSSSISFYFTRSENNSVFHQTDWAGGSDQTGPISNPGTKYDTATNITDSAAGQITIATTTASGFLTSSILDSGVNGGASFHSLLWQGTLCSSCLVKFQLASSNSSSGPWTYYGPTSTSDYYSPNPGVAITLPRNGDAAHQNKRYIRYKVYLEPYNSQSPEVDDIIINWSP